MTKYVHIVYVHPVELGEPNLAKVNEEKEFDTWKQAMGYVEHFNAHAKGGVEAVYYGRVNDATGELE